MEISDQEMKDYEDLIKEQKKFHEWRDRAVKGLPELANRIFALRGKQYNGWGFHYGLEKSIGYLLWRLNDFEIGCPFEGPEAKKVWANRLALEVNLSNLYERVVAAEKSLEEN
jgi:hypothetical protein